MSQLDLALQAEISQRHLSFIESGRSRPSREMVMHLTESLGVPLRERNAVMLAAGYAPHFPERSLDDPALAPARAAVELILEGHEPYPAIAIDRRWNLVAANRAVQPLLDLVTDASLLRPPVNVLMLTFAPGGLTPHILNLAEWHAHVMERLRQQISVSADREIVRLLDVLGSLVDRPPDPAERHGSSVSYIAVPLRIQTPAGVLSLISTTTIFGTPVDITLSELALESFFPADAQTAETLRAMATPDRSESPGNR